MDIDAYSDLDFGESVKPYWFCDSCRHKDYNKAMPKDREAFYKQVAGKGIAARCPKCKSMSLMPVGF